MNRREFIRNSVGLALVAAYGSRNVGKRNVVNASPLHDEELDGLLARCETSIEAHCRVFHPNRFTRPFSRQHYRLFEVLDDWSVQKVLLIGHRGLGKSSILSYAVPSQAIMFKKAKFIVPCSATAKLAVLQSENLKKALTGDRDIKAIIGDLRTNNFSMEDWKTKNGVFVLPRGVEQQIRGVIETDDRPDLPIADDLEKTESVMSDDQRKKLKTWFWSDFMYCVDRSSRNWRALVGGTILHEASLLQELREDSSWTCIEMPLCDEEFKSYWPAFMTDKDIQEELQQYRSRGLTDVFYRENMNIAIAAEDRVFNTENFKYYDEAELKLNENRLVDNFIIVDPAKTAKVHSDFTAIVGVGFNPKDHAVYVRDVVNRRMRPDEIYEEIFAMLRRLNTRLVGLEVTGLNEFIVQPFKNEMTKRGMICELIELKARKGEGRYATGNRGKEGRIAALAPYYRMGYIYHNKACCDVLEQQLLSFPRSKYDDVSDALAYFIEMVEIGSRYFDTEMFVESQKEVEKEYDGLYTEEEMEPVFEPEEDWALV